MENEAQKSAGKVWLIPTIIAAVLLIGLIVFMVIMGKGTSAVADGTVTLAESVAPLKDGTAQLSDGVDQYTEGVDTIHKAMPTLEDGVKQYTEGVDQLNGYMKELNSATPTLASGVAALNKGVNGEGDNLSNGMQTLTDGLSAVNAGVNGKDGLAESTPLLAGGTGQLLAEMAKAEPDMNSALALAAGVKAQVGDIFAGMPLPASEAEVSTVATQYAVKAYIVLVGRQGQTIDETAALQAMGANPNDLVVTIAQLLGAYGLAENASYTAASGAYESIKARSEEEMKVMAENEQATLYTGIYQLHGGLVALNTAVNVGDGTASNPGLAKAVALLADGANKLNAGINGKDGLADGVKALNAGVNGKDGLVSSVSKLYKEGSNKLAENSGALRDGVKQLADGAKKLSENSDALRDGASQLKDAAPALIDGIQQLVDGAKQVKGFVPGNK